MDTPETTLLVVLQVVGLILTLLLLVGARQARHRIGAWLWVAGFAMHPASQALRQVVTASLGHFVGLPFGRCFHSVGPKPIEKRVTRMPKRRAAR